MFKKFNNSSSDFDVSNLPHTRKEAFYDIIKQRYRLLVLLGILLLCFSLPLILALFVQARINYNISLEITSGALEYQHAIEQLISYKTITSCFILFGIIIASIGIAGCSKIFLKLTFLEGIIIGYDLKEGMKSNFKDIAFFGILMFIVFFALDYMSSLILLNKIELLTFMIVLPYAFLLLIFIPCYAIYINLTCIYSDKITQKIKNSFYIYTKYLPKILAFVVILLLPFILIIQPNFIVSGVVVSLYFILLLPLIILAWFLFANKMFDECINLKHYPQIVNKGLER